MTRHIGNPLLGQMLEVQSASGDVFGCSPASHLLFDYIEIDGLRLPTRRCIYPRHADGSLRPDLHIMTAALANYILR